jgi:hypothetical protein
MEDGNIPYRRQIVYEDDGFSFWYTRVRVNLSSAHPTIPRLGLPRRAEVAKGIYKVPLETVPLRKVHEADLYPPLFAGRLHRQVVTVPGVLPVPGSVPDWRPIFC